MRLRKYELQSRCVSAKQIQSLSKTVYTMIQAKSIKCEALAIVIGVGIGIMGDCANAAVSDCGNPRIGWTLNPQNDGGIRTLYWATTNSSELWLVLKSTQPLHDKPGIPELLLVFSICFPGKEMASPQRAAELRVQINRNFVPALVPDPDLQITIDNDRYELTGRNFTHWTEYPLACSPGDSCAYTAVLVNLPMEILRRIVLATKVQGTISGTAFELTAGSRRKLGLFVNRIAGN